MSFTHSVSFGCVFFVLMFIYDTTSIMDDLTIISNGFKTRNGTDNILQNGSLTQCMLLSTILTKYRKI